MPTPTEDYQSTLKRLEDLRQRRAVLADRAEKIADLRKGLAEKLAASGVDVSNLPAEKERLQAQLTELRAHAQEQVDKFEEHLNRAERGELPQEVHDPAALVGCEGIVHPSETGETDMEID